MARRTGILQEVIGTIGRLLGQCHGGIAVTFALALPVVIGAMGIASDYGMMIKLRTDLQKAADAAAVAGAREIPLARTNAAQIKSAAQSFATFALTGDSAATAAALKGSDLTITITVIDNFSAVKVDVSQVWTPFFAHFLQAGITPIKVTATARFVGSNNICVLGLAGSGRGVYLDKNSRLTGNNCGVFSNSTASDSLSVNTGAYLKAQVICAAGGSNTSSSGSVDPLPVTDCPAMADPLVDRPAPSSGGCDQTGFSLLNQTRTLNPGVYCGGLTVDGISTVTLSPGTYVIKNGPLLIEGKTTLKGDGVSFFVTGSSPGSLLFTPNTHISLSAPVNGTMAGLLVFEDRDLGVKLKHKISSNDAHSLIGTIYLPVGDLVVDANKPVADQSAYTAIIVQHLELNSGPNLVLNSNYETTDVPVPAGLKGTKQVILTQ